MDNEHPDSSQEALGAVDVFCKHMVSVRESAGFSIQRASLATRISQPFVTSLETGEFTQLPGVVFGRGFIRSLCKAYQCPEEEEALLEAFDKACSEMGLEDVGMGSTIKEETANFKDKRDFSAITWPKIARGLNPAHYFRIVPFYAVQALLLLVCGLIYALFQTSPFSDKKEANLEANKAPIAAKTSEKSRVVVDIEEVAAEKTAPKEALLALGQQKVVMHFKKQGALRVKVDKADWVEQELPAASHVWEFKESAQFVLKDPEGVRVEFNGQSIGPLKAGLGYKKLSFSSDPPSLDRPRSM